MEIKHGVVHIHDWDQLAETAEFETSYLVGGTVPHRQARLLAAVSSESCLKAETQL